MKKSILILLAAFSICAAASLAEVPDVSSLTLDELMELQGNVNEAISSQSTYTLLPGVYDCKKDFKWNWYNCKVVAGKNGEEKTATITFHNYSPEEDPFLTYEISSDDDGIKLSLLQTGSSAQLFMVVQGATLEAVPYSGF